VNPSPSNPENFIRAHTALARPPLVPEISLYLATEITPIWQATEAWLQAQNIAPPFWAFAWPGSQAIARFILDHPNLVKGRRVLDFAAGCGLAALAASRAGAASVEVAEIDPLAIAACQLNAGANGLTLTGLAGDIVGTECRWDMILTGDVFYEAPMTRHILPWLENMASAGATILVADPGRAYLPHKALGEIARYDVPTSLELEDYTQRTTVLYRLGTDNT
jgi:predicted nicotinamide N-methyase